MKKLQKCILKNELLSYIFSYLYSIKSIIKIKRGTNNTIVLQGSFLKNTKIYAFNNNTIILSRGSHLVNCSLLIYGQNNIIQIGNNCSLNNMEIHIEDNYNKVIIGNHTTIAGKTHLACIEGTEIHIGEDCMFSKEIIFRTGDSHSIVDLEGVRINPSKDIYIGNHVWVGNKVILTKGSRIPNNSIVGTGAIVGKEFVKSNVIIAGVPAKVVKENINWKRERI